MTVSSTVVTAVRLSTQSRDSSLDVPTDASEKHERQPSSSLLVQRMLLPKVRFNCPRDTRRGKRSDVSRLDS